MSNRTYKYVALGTLIAAPIIVQILSSVVPAEPQAAEATNEAVSAPPQQPEEVAEKPVVVTQPQQAPSSDPLVQTTPTLDTQGIAPTAAGAVQYAAAPPPAAPAPGTVEKPADDVEPAPRRRPTHTDH
jgi:hypothetical protein